MHTRAVIFERPGRLVIDQVQLIDPSDCDLVIKVLWSGISTGTERLLWSGDMPTISWHWGILWFPVTKP